MPITNVLKAMSSGFPTVFAKMVSEISQLTKDLKFHRELAVRDKTGDMSGMRWKDATTQERMMKMIDGIAKSNDVLAWQLADFDAIRAKYDAERAERQRLGITDILTGNPKEFYEIVIDTTTSA